METISWTEWLGYFSSIVITVSLLMSSIIKLRWLNLFGAALMAVYGLLIHALPILLLNSLIAAINIVHLFKIYSAKEKFKILEIEKNHDYLNYFFETYRDEIRKIFPDFKMEKSMIGFYLLRNLVPAGIFIGQKENDGIFRIELDFVTPEYRDFKLGHYIFSESSDFFAKLGYKRFCSMASNPTHIRYLTKMGFSEKERTENYIVMIREIR